MDRADPVMVGIDGSTASVRAAVWAADEAAARDTTLGLLYVIDPTAVEHLDDAMATARHAIHRAWEAVTASDRHVKLELEILQGNPVIELANAARRGALICLGHKGTKDSAPKGRGSTASSLADLADLRRRGPAQTHAPPTVVPPVGRDSRRRISRIARDVAGCARRSGTARSPSAGSHDVVDGASSQAPFV
jgi:nucleotide-binding universal stress UspA family protein